MNITFPSLNTSYRSAVPAQQKTMPRKAAVKGDYDTINIRRPKAADDDETFARMLARKTASQLGSAGTERIAELRGRVADGTYVPDAQRIAGRMLGLG